MSIALVQKTLHTKYYILYTINMLNKQTYLKTAQAAAEELGIEAAINEVTDKGGTLTFNLAEKLKEKDKKYLEKELSNIFNQQINLKVADLRKKAAKTGGIGPCGMTLCCKRWLSKPLDPDKENLQSEQIMSTNNSFEGACGETLCCLCYAQGASTCAGGELQNSENGSEDEKGRKDTEKQKNKETKKQKKGRKKIRRLKI